ncbi:hypothetical protein vBKpnAMK6_00214 [Klebsiella phage vB_Kpn_AM_K6]
MIKFEDIYEATIREATIDNFIPILQFSIYTQDFFISA